MALPSQLTQDTILKEVVPDRPVLIAGPTASGKSDLALKIAQAQGGVIVNADASQVYDCWRVLTARPSDTEMALAPHALYGHISAFQTYSAGHWLRDVKALLHSGTRPIIVGGTGLYFTALTEGLAEIPATCAEVRATADGLSREEMLAELDTPTRDKIDVLNPMRVQRAWEVLRSTGRGLADWQSRTGTPALALADTQPIVVDAPKDWLLPRIAERFDKMIEGGALDEARRLRPDYDPDLPAHRAIGAPELMSYLDGDTTLEEAKEAAVIATRQFAKRQRTWFRARMGSWSRYLLG